MKKVTKKEYQDRFMNVNAKMELKGDYPYTVEWRLNNTLIAKAVSKMVSSIKKETEYFISPK